MLRSDEPLQNRLLHVFATHVARVLSFPKPSKFPIESLRLHEILKISTSPKAFMSPQ